MKTNGPEGARRLVFALALLAAAAAVTVQIIEGPPGSGYGWGSVVISGLLVATPLLAIGILVRSGEARQALAADVVATLVMLLVGMALAGNWAEQSSSDRLLDVGVALLVLVVAVGTFAVSAPLLRRPRA